MTTEIILKSTIDALYIQHMGDDRAIVRAMLASTVRDGEVETMSEDALYGRINFLLKNRHGSPTECGALTIRVHAPIKVWREWHRHRIGFSYNEESARYRQLEPVFWMPPRDRPMIRPVNFKSANPAFEVATEVEYDMLSERFRRVYQVAYDTYENLLGAGFDRGLARDVLGVGIFSTCYVTCNPRSIMAFLELRTNHPEAKRPSKPLWEIEQAANQLEAIFAQHWPLTHRAWASNGRMAP